MYLQKKPVFQDAVFDGCLLMDWMVGPILRREKKPDTVSLLEERLRSLYMFCLLI